MKTAIIFTLLVLTFGADIVRGQVEKQIIIEHFTNTLCSVCAAKNPDLNDNLENHPEVIHISYHPSSPYSACLLNQHNVSGNDDRTNQYGIYGATPRIVIQGEVISPNQDFADANLFANYENEFSPILLNTFIDSVTIDSVYVSVVVKTVSAITSNNPLLYVGLIEDTLYYNAPNGESIHYGVFRKPLNGNQGQQVTVPNIIGDSIVFKFKSSNHADWNLNRLAAFGILQDNSNLSVIQSSISGIVHVNNSSIQEQEGDEGFDVHFNPQTNVLTILSEDCRGFVSYEIISITGQVVQRGSLNSNLNYVVLSQITNGIFLIRLVKKDQEGYSKALKFLK